MLRKKFWTGRFKEELKASTRHRYDFNSGFNELLIAVGRSEEELKISENHAQVYHAQNDPVNSKLD